jgi:hypothetical protein
MRMGGTSVKTITRMTTPRGIWNPIALRKSVGA